MNIHAISARFTAVFVAIAFAAAPVVARSKHAAPKPGSEDSIDVVGHLPLPVPPPQAVELGNHWDRNYLFLSGNDDTFTIVDVTDPVHPAITEQAAVPEAVQRSRPLLLVGTAGLLIGSEETALAPVVKTISIIQWNGPNGARVVRQFDHVTAYRQDPGRSLVYIVDSNELWVVRVHAAPNSRIDEEYAHHVLYDR